MITWFTRFSFDRSAADLTDITLGQQIDEGYEVFKALTGQDSKVDDNAPVLRMWEGYEFALGLYVMCAGDQFTRIRRNIDMTFYEVYNDMQVMKQNDPEFVYEAPPWFRDADLCRSHRSNLIRRQPENYNDGRWPGTPPVMPYLWPFIDDSEDGYSLMVSKAERDLLAKGERKLPKAIKERVANL